MRAVWKLSVIVLLGVGVQCSLVRWADDIDEAAFTLRVFCAARAGVPFDDPELIAAANELFRRQCRRHGAFPVVEPREEEVLVVAFACEP